MKIYLNQQRHKENLMVDEFKLENKQVFLASGDSSPPRNTAKDVGAHVFRLRVS